MLPIDLSPTELGRYTQISAIKDIINSIAEILIYNFYTGWFVLWMHTIKLLKEIPERRDIGLV